MASRSVKQMRYAPQSMVSAPKSRPSLLNSVRSSIATQRPKARSAMLGRSISQDATDRNGNRLGERRQVGEGTPAARRAALDAALKPGPAVKSSPKMKPALQDSTGTGSRARSKKIDELVTKMQ